MMVVPKLGAAALAMACLHLSQGGRIGVPLEEPMVTEPLGDEQDGVAQLVAAAGATRDKHTNIFNYAGSAYISSDPTKAKKKLLEEARGILIVNEDVEMAFKVGYDKMFFTDLRVICRSGSSSPTYQSIPYTSIKAFTITTLGAHPNLVLHTGVHSNDGTLNIKFSKGHGPNILDVGGLFASKITGAKDFSRAPEAEKVAPQIGNLVGIRGTETVDVRTVLADMRFLGNNELVQAVFTVRRPRSKIVETFRERQRAPDRADLIVMTSTRVVRVQVHRASSKIDITTIPNRAIKGFVVTSPGDSVELPKIKIWTNIPSLPSLQQKVLDYVNVELILKLLSSAVTGAPQADGSNSMNEMNQQIKETLQQAGILQSLDQERIVKYFKSNRHLVVLTSQRLILAEKVVYTDGVKYTILPYRSILAWNIEKVNDGTKLHLWTDMSEAGDVACPTTPEGDDCMSFLEIFLGRDDANVKSIHKLLSLHLLDHSSKLASTGNVSFDAVEEGSSTPFSSLFDIETDGLGAAPEAFMKAEFLQRGETVSMIHRTDNTVRMWTNKRFVEFKANSLMSIPYHAIKVFELMTAGVAHSPKLVFQMNMPSFAKYEYLLADTDIEHVVRFVGDVLPRSGSASEAAAENLDEHIKNLLGTEQVEFASKPIRDRRRKVQIRTVLTTQRALLVETPSMSSRITYITIPYSSARMFEIDEKGKATFHLETLLKESVAQKFTEGNQTKKTAVQAWHILSAKTLHLEV